MKTTVEEISTIKKKILIEIPEDEVKKEIDSFYVDLGKKTRIKGFRPGKAPRNILERHFKDYAKAEVTQKIVEDSFPKALTETNLQPVASPVIEPGEIEPGKDFQFSATVEIKPDIQLEGYTGLTIEGKKEEIKEEEVEERLKNLQDLHANLKTLAEPRPIQSGDFAVIDYEAKMDGKSLQEGKGADFTLEVGSGRFIPALEEKLVGLRLEEEKELDVAFPEDYGYKKWAGKTVSFQVKIKEIKEKVLPVLDDEFAKDLGDYSTLDELKAKLREEIQKEKASALDRQLKDQLIEQLLKTNLFDVPDSLVDEQTKALVSDMKLRLASQGMDIKNLGVTEEKLQEDYKEAAQKQVHTYLILEKIAQQEGITVTDEEADNRLKEISERSRQKFDAVKRYYEKNGLIPEVKAGILNDKTLSFLLEKAHVNYI